MAVIEAESALLNHTFLFLQANGPTTPGHNYLWIRIFPDGALVPCPYGIRACSSPFKPSIEDITGRGPEKKERS